MPTLLYPMVKSLLEANPILRDSDRMLLWEVWKVTGHVIDGEITRQSFIDAPHFESIRRVRQKIQEKYPHLQSSKGVLAHKRRKQATKSTFVYRETIPVRFVGDKAIYE